MMMMPRYSYLPIVVLSFVSLCPSVREAVGGEWPASDVDCSWSFVAACRAVLGACSSEYQVAVPDALPVGAENAIKRLSDGRSPVAFMLASEMAIAQGREVSWFECRPLGRYVVAVIVNSRNRASSINVEELRGVVAGKIRSWKEIKGADIQGSIEIPPSCLRLAVKSIVRQRLLEGEKLASDLDLSTAGPSARILSPSEVIRFVRENSNSLAFVLMPLDGQFGEGIRVLGLRDGKTTEARLPQAVTVATGAYPLADRIVAIIQPGHSEEVSRIVSYFEDKRGAEILSTFSVWPEYELEQVRAKQRLADAKAGKGMPITASGPAAGEAVVKALAMKYVEAKQAVQVKYLKRGQGAGARGEGKNEGLGARDEGKAEVVAKFLEGGSDLLVVEEGQGAEGELAGCKRMPIGTVALGVIVHPDNELKSLPMDELRQICAGEVKAWLGGAGEKPAPTSKKAKADSIRGYALQAMQPAMRIYYEKLAGNRAAGAGLKLTALADTQKVVLAVAREPGAIGFVDLSQMPKDEGSVKLVTIIPSPPAPLPQAGEGSNAPSPQVPLPKGEGRAGGPNPESPVPGPEPPTSNPLSHTLVLYVSPTAGQAAKDFADYLDKNAFPDLLAEHNLLPARTPEELMLAQGKSPASVAVATRTDSKSETPITIDPSTVPDLGLPSLDIDGRPIPKDSAKPRELASVLGANTPSPAEGDLDAKPSPPAPLPEGEGREEASPQAASADEASKNGGLSNEQMGLIAAGGGGLLVVLLVFVGLRPGRRRRNLPPEMKIEI